MTWLFGLLVWLLGSKVCFAEYTSLIPAGELDGIGTDVHTVAIWAIGIFIVICAVGVLARVFGH